MNKETPKRTQVPGTKKYPNPKAARLAAGLTWRQLMDAAQVSNGLVARCEKTGRYPANRNVRAAYLAALGLTESEVSP